MLWVKIFLFPLELHFGNNFTQKYDSCISAVRELQDAAPDSWEHISSSRFLHKFIHKFLDILQKPMISDSIIDW